MIEELCGKLSAQHEIRASLIQLKQLVKEPDALHEWRQYHVKHPVLFAFLQDGDPKVRKNAALLLGVTEGDAAADALYDAYCSEETLFVRSAYLIGMAGVDMSAHREELDGIYRELLAKEVPEHERKHRSEEIHALSKVLRNMTKEKCHRFYGYEAPMEVLLTTNPAYREVTARQIQSAHPRLTPAGVKVENANLRELLGIRTYRELLFLLPGGHHIPPEPEAIAAAFVRAGVVGIMRQMHEGDAPYYFRLEIRIDMPEPQRGILIQKAAAQIELQSGNELINAPDGYEVELRLTQNKDGSLYPSMKLFTIPMRRFSYRKEAVAASIHPANAALLMQLAEPYLKEGAQVLDPFCGVGTMLIERDMLVPAGDMYGTDIFGEAIVKARENAAAAGRAVNYINRDFFDFTHKYLFDEIVTNMPMRGRRTKEEQDAFYGIFFVRAAKLLRPEALLMLYTNEEGFVKKQLRLHKEYRLLEEFCIRKKDGFYLFLIRFKG
ncbi:MAG: methyltransferase [Lachnospiraceae bacterium]|nr:methyltransferase [Lachnospiraceae bacterium]